MKRRCVELIYADKNSSVLDCLYVRVICVHNTLFFICVEERVHFHMYIRSLHMENSVHLKCLLWKGLVYMRMSII